MILPYIHFKCMTLSSAAVWTHPTPGNTHDKNSGQETQLQRIAGEECGGVPEGSSIFSNEMSSNTVSGDGGDVGGGRLTAGAGLCGLMGRRVPSLPRLASLPIFHRIPGSAATSATTQINITTTSNHNQLTANSIMGIISNITVSSTITVLNTTTITISDAVLHHTLWLPRHLFQLTHTSQRQIRCEKLADLMSHGLEIHCTYGAYA